MRMLLLFPLLLLLNIVAFSQTDENISYKNQIGLDATTFVKQYLNFSPSVYYYYSPPSYLLSYKRLGEDQALRIGLNGYHEVKKDTGGYNSLTNYTDQSSYFDLRLGYEYRYQLNERWLVSYGADLLGGYTYSVQHNMGTPFGNPDWIHKILRVGGGPVLGIQFQLSQRLYLSTEATLYFVYSKDREFFEYEEYPEENSQGLHEKTQIIFSPPMNVVFNFSF